MKKSAASTRRKRALTGAGSVSSSPATTSPPVTGTAVVSLESIVRELRKDLKEARAEIASLRSDLNALSQRHAEHRHAYERLVVPGSGGFTWFSLRFLKRYFDDDKTNFDDMGVYFRGGPSTGNTPATHQTGTPV